MGPKKKAVVNEGSKKPGKASKLAKMNEQERTRYLEKKMAEEEELKRRKEEMIHVFLKMKIGQEEDKGQFNSLKLVDNWRRIRRAAKTKELQHDVTILKEAFERAVQQKARHIELLLQELDESEEQYNMAFRDQMDSLSNMMTIHNQRIEGILRRHENSREGVLNRSEVEREQMGRQQTRAVTYLDDVLIALNLRHDTREQQITNEYQAVKDEIRNKNVEERQALNHFMEEAMDNLWKQLQSQVTNFKNNTEEKRRIYNELLSKDQKGIGEVAENNRKISKLMEDLVKLKETISELDDVEEKRLSALRLEQQELTRQLHSARRNVSVNDRKVQQQRLKKLATKANSLENLVARLEKEQETTVKMAESCIKLESATKHLTDHLPQLTEDEILSLKQIDGSDKTKPNLQLIITKINSALITQAALKHEKRQLEKGHVSLTNQLRSMIQLLGQGGSGSLAHAANSLSIRRHSLFKLSKSRSLSASHSHKGRS